MMYLAENEVHIWMARDEEIADPGLLTSYHQLLSKEESAQQRRFHFPKHRHQFLVTRALVRTVLSQYFDDIPPEDWQFHRNSYNRPYISSPPLPFSLQFNISHTEQMIILAISVDSKVGIDVEYLSRDTSFRDLARHNFSEVEFQEMLMLPSDRQKRRFYDLWTLKEAYIKACGMGLSIPLNHFSYQFSGNDLIGISFSPERQDDPKQWNFWQFQPDATHVAALAVHDLSMTRRFSLTMREVVPLSSVKAVDLAITAQSRREPVRVGVPL